MLNQEQRKQFKIICQKYIPQNILYICNSNDWLDVAFFGNKDRDIYCALYNLNDADLDFVFGRLHFALNEWFDNNSYRISKNNRYLTSGSRGEINALDLALKKIKSFFGKIGLVFNINSDYELKTQYLVNFISIAAPEYTLPNDYNALETVVDEPIFSIRKYATFNEPKYLFFGVSKEKPDIRIKDVIDGNLDIVNQDDIIVYDEEIKGSLTYRDFNLWWQKNRKKYSWYRLEEQLQPRELKVQNFYKQHYAMNEDNPILIPQVYLHYDPKNKQERQKCKINETMIFQRMDFLILYNNRRIIIEIDGQSHFETNNRIDLTKYSKQVEYDRTMKFLGYEIFRLCNYEIDSCDYEKTLEVFFSNLYRYLGIIKA